MNRNPASSSRSFGRGWPGEFAAASRARESDDHPGRRGRTGPAGEAHGVLRRPVRLRHRLRRTSAHERRPRPRPRLPRVLGRRHRDRHPCAREPVPVVANGVDASRRASPASTPAWQARAQLSGTHRWRGILFGDRPASPKVRVPPVRPAGRRRRPRQATFGAPGSAWPWCAGTSAATPAGSATSRSCRSSRPRERTSHRPDTASQNVLIKHRSSAERVRGEQAVMTIAMTTVLGTPGHARVSATPDGVRLSRPRQSVGRLCLWTSGVNVGVVVTDTEFYRAFADIARCRWSRGVSRACSSRR